MEKQKAKKVGVHKITEENNKETSNIPKEALSNSMTSIENKSSLIWRPNNYRRQIIVKEKDNSAIQKILSAIGIIPTDTRVNFNPHTKILSIRNYQPNITIQYAKNTLTAIYYQNIISGVKETYLISRNTQKEVDERLDEIKNSIQEKIDNTLTDFIKKANIGIMFNKPMWIRHEDFAKGESFIDSIPREVIIHDTFFKKVYPVGIEFMSNKEIREPTTALKNYIKNRAIEDISPIIANELLEVKEMVKEGIALNLSSVEAFNAFSKGFLPELTEFHKDIKVHNRVLKGIEKGINILNRRLGISKRTSLINKANEMQLNLKKW